MRLLINLMRHYVGTTVHKAWVLWYCVKFSAKLMRRAVLHDLSKYSDVETESFVRIIHKLRNSTYGSDAYREMLAKDDTVRKGTAHHYVRNRHHPEHFIQNSDGAPTLRVMNLLDIVEMFCDWRSAVKRHKNGDIHRSIVINKVKFQMSDDMIGILSESTDL